MTFEQQSHQHTAENSCELFNDYVQEALTIVEDHFFKMSSREIAQFMHEKFSPATLVRMGPLYVELRDEGSLDLKFY